MKKIKKKTLLILCVVCISVVSLSIFIFGGKKESDEKIYREYNVTRGDIIVGIDGFGSLKLESENQYFENEFVIEEIYVSIGETVIKEQKLAKLSDDNINEQIEKLAEELRKAEDTYNQAINNKDIQQANSSTTWQEKVNASKNTYDQKKAEMESNKTKLEETIASCKQRIIELEDLISKASVTTTEEVEGETPPTTDPNVESYKKELEEVKVKLAEAENQLIENGNSLQQLENNRQTEINSENQSKSNHDYVQNENNTNSDILIDAAKREVDRINSEISKITKVKKNPYLYAQSDGVVTEISYKVNTKVDLSSTGIVIGDMEKKKVLVSVEQNDIIKIEKDQKVEIKFSAYGDTVFYGTVDSKDLVGKNSNGSIKYDVYVSVDAQGKEILPEMTCSTKFISKEVNNILKLSNKAIQLIDGVQYVDVKKEDGTIERRTIKTGFSDGKTSEVIDGLAESDIVVVES